MNNANVRPDSTEKLEKLLEKVTPTSGTLYEEHRKMLDEKISKAHYAERRMRIVIAALLCICLLIIWQICIMALVDDEGLFKQVANRIVPGNGFALAVPLVSVVMLLALITTVYLLVYRRRLERACHDAREVAIASLEQRIDELTRHAESNRE